MTSRSVAGLTVLVTGAASGMGRATAEVFAAEGAHVACIDIALLKGTLVDLGSLEPGSYLVRTTDGHARPVSLTIT